MHSFTINRRAVHIISSSWETVLLESHPSFHDLREKVFTTVTMGMTRRVSIILSILGRVTAKVSSFV